MGTNTLRTAVLAVGAYYTGGATSALLTQAAVSQATSGLAQQSAVTPPAPQVMPTADTEATRQARLRATRRMVSQSSGRESTILGGSQTGGSAPTGGLKTTLGGA